jgi:hypothetical protein
LGIGSSREGQRKAAPEGKTRIEAQSCGKTVKKQQKSAEICRNQPISERDRQRLREKERRRKERAEGWKYRHVGSRSIHCWRRCYA